MGLTPQYRGVTSLKIQKRSPSSPANMIDQLTSFCPTYNATIDSLILIEGAANDVLTEAVHPDTYNKANFITDLTTCLSIVTGKGWPTNRIVVIAGNVITPTSASLLIQDSIFAAFQSVTTSAGVRLADIYHESQYHIANLWTPLDQIHPGLSYHSQYGQNLLSFLGNTVKDDKQRIAANDTSEFLHIKFTAPDTTDGRDAFPIVADAHNNLRKGANGMYVQTSPFVTQSGSIQMADTVAARKTLNGGMIQAFGTFINDGKTFNRFLAFTTGDTLSAIGGFKSNPGTWTNLEINPGGGYVGLGAVHDPNHIDRLVIGGAVNVTGGIKASGTSGTGAITGPSVTLSTNSSIGFLGAVNWNGSTFGAPLPLVIQYLGGNTAMGWNGTPTAKLHLGAGTATAGTGPLKFTSGPLTTTPEIGLMHFLNGLWFGDSSNSVRDTFAMRKWIQQNFAPIGSVSGGSIPTLQSVFTNERATHDGGIAVLTKLDTISGHNTAGVGLKIDSMASVVINAGNVSINSTATGAAALAVVGPTIALRAGLQQQNVVFSSSFTLTQAVTASLFVDLATPSSNSTITLGSPGAQIGSWYKISNQSTSGSFTWTFTGSTLIDGQGNTVTTIPNGYMYEIISAPNGGNWQIKNISYVGAAPGVNRSSIVASADLAAQTSAGTVLSYTPTVTSTYRVGGYAAITAISVNTINVFVLWTDENGTTRSYTLLTNTGVTGYNPFSDIQIRAQSGSAISIGVNVTGAGSQTYDAGATIEKIR